MATSGSDGWQMVSRRRRFPTAQATNSTPPLARPFVPYAPRPTYAQALLQRNSMKNPAAQVLQSATSLPLQPHGSSASTLVPYLAATPPQTNVSPILTHRPLLNIPHMAVNTPPNFNAAYGPTSTSHQSTLTNSSFLPTQHAVTAKQTTTLTTKSSQPSTAPPVRLLTPSPALTILPKNLPPLNLITSNSQVPPPLAIGKSPHSPTKLRFPGSTAYPEWRGRCFNCMRRGHKDKQCKSLKRCGNCWGKGHTFKDCMNNSITTVLTQEGIEQTQCPPKNDEPDFTPLLKDPYPTSPAFLPDESERPTSLPCHITRDRHHFNEVERLSRGLVITVPDRDDMLFTEDSIASLVASVAKLPNTEFMISPMPKGRFLVLPPPQMDPFQLCSNFPDYLWEQGLSFQVWSPLIDAQVSIPTFLVWIDVLDIPPHLWREDYIMQAIGLFGTYLGTIDNDTPGDLTKWSTAVAVGDLRDIPRAVTFKAGGLAFEAPLIPKRWICKQLYGVNDLPSWPDAVVRPAYRSPPHRSISPSSSNSSQESLGDDVVSMSLKTMREILKDVDYNLLPEDMALALRGDKEAIRRNYLAHRPPNHPDFQETESTQPVATQEPTSPQPHSISQEETHEPTQEPPHSQAGLLSQQLKRQSNFSPPEPSIERSMGKRFCFGQEPPTQVLFPTFSNDSNLGIMGMGSECLFPELADQERHSQLRNVSSGELVPFSEQVQSVSSSLGSGELCCPAITLSHEELNHSLGSNTFLPPGPNTQSEILIVGSSCKPAQCQIIELNPDDFVDVPLAYVEAHNLSDLIGYKRLDFPEKFVLSSSRPPLRPRIKKSPPNKAVVLSAIVNKKKISGTTKNKYKGTRNNSSDGRPSVPTSDVSNSTSNSDSASFQEDLDADRVPLDFELDPNDELE